MGFPGTNIGIHPAINGKRDTISQVSLGGWTLQKPTSSGPNCWFARPKRWERASNNLQYRAHGRQEFENTEQESRQLGGAQAADLLCTKVILPLSDGVQPVSWTRDARAEQKNLKKGLRGEAAGERAHVP